MSIFAVQCVKRPLLRVMDIFRRTLSDVRTLRSFPELEACHALEILKLDRAGIQEVPTNLCRQTPRLKSLYVETLLGNFETNSVCVDVLNLKLKLLSIIHRELKTNSLKHIPNLSSCRDLRLL